MILIKYGSKRKTVGLIVSKDGSLELRVFCRKQRNRAHQETVENSLRVTEKG